MKKDLLKILCYHLSAFFAAFLLFSIQPASVKKILPVFGGSNLVWAASMVFFQGMLLLGYLFAHFAQKRFGVARYARVHPVLFIAAGTSLFLIPDMGRFAGMSSGKEFFSVLFILFFITGVPFFFLSASAPLLQRWLSVSSLEDRNNPYVLYGSSNLGSLLGLLSYPVLIEPFFSLNTQMALWRGGYFILSLLFFFCVPRRPEENISEPSSVPQAQKGSRLIWILLSAGSSSLLLATTNVLTFDIASIPFLWVLPLSIYLLTFVAVFKKRPWLPSWSKASAFWFMAVGLVLYVMSRFRIDFSPFTAIAVYLAVLFFVCLFAGRLLAASKPENPAELTDFYVCISLGGLLGSVLVSGIIPLISTSPAEYPSAFFLAAVSFFFAERSEKTKERNQTYKDALIAGLFAIAIMALFFIFSFMSGQESFIRKKIFLFIFLILLFLMLRRMSRKSWHFAIGALSVMISLAMGWGMPSQETAVLKKRNFYGIYRVFDKGDERYLQHGMVLHGRQYREEKKKNIPLSYFHPSAPAGEILSRGELKFPDTAIIGLGAGALTAYFGQDDRISYFELDPDNILIAEKYFSYLDVAEKKGAALRFIAGDGRMSLRKEKENSFDLLVIDAFSSGSIPVHLLTVEALQEYFRVLKPGGLLLMHISNKMLRLEPVVMSIGAKLNIPAASKDYGQTDPDADSCTWAALCRDSSKIALLCSRYGWTPSAAQGLPTPWTDQYCNLLGAMRGF